MNQVLRLIGILIDPSAEWSKIEKEPGDPLYLMSRYVVYLALVPAVFEFIGSSLIGATVPGGVVHASLLDGLLGALFLYLESFAAVLLLGLFIGVAAPLFGGRANFPNAFKLAVYSSTPVWLAGVFLLLPGLRFLMLTGLYGIYLLVLGLPALMKSPVRRSAGFAMLVVVFACALTYVAATAQYMLFALPV